MSSAEIFTQMLSFKREEIVSERSNFFPLRDASTKKGLNYLHMSNLLPLNEYLFS